MVVVEARLSATCVSTSLEGLTLVAELTDTDTGETLASAAFPEADRDGRLTTRLDRSSSSSRRQTVILRSSGLTGGAMSTRQIHGATRYLSAFAAERLARFGAFTAQDFEAVRIIAGALRPDEV